MEQQNIIISICMIMKNEERCLERCLKSLTPLREQLPCELIITDTGSTDRSIEIAEKYADKLLHFEWCNDFSAARNFGLEQAKGEWIMVIDADEELVEDVSHLVKFFTSEEKYKYYGCFLKKKNCFDAKICSSVESLKDYEGAESAFLDYRVFRNNDNTRYEGIIHETVPYRNPAYTFNSLVLYHDGYAYEDPKKRKEKGFRNASLLEKALKENLYDLRQINLILNDSPVLNKEAHKNLILLTEKVMYKNLSSSFSPDAFVKVANYYRLHDEIEKSLKICKEYLKYFIDERCRLFEIDIRFIQADCLFKQKQYRPALKMIDNYFKLIDSYENGKLDLFLLRTGSIKFQGKGAENYLKHIQIQCYIELKDLAKAGELLKKTDLSKKDDGVFHNFFLTLVRLTYFDEANISLADYYPMLIETMRTGNENEKKVAKETYDIVHSYIANVPDYMKTAILKQIASLEGGEEELKEAIKKKEKEKKENFEKFTGEIKNTIKKLMVEPSMKGKALDLVKQLKAIAPEDEEVKEFIKVLSE